MEYVLYSLDDDEDKEDKLDEEDKLELSGVVPI